MNQHAKHTKTLIHIYTHTLTNNYFFLKYFTLYIHFYDIIILLNLYFTINITFYCYNLYTSNMTHTLSTKMNVAMEMLLSLQQRIEIQPLHVHVDEC